MSDTTPQHPVDVVGKGALSVAAILMALPAAIPALVLIEPSLVPFVGDVDTTDTGMIAFLVGMSFVLLLLNWGFLYLIYRWLNKMAQEQEI
ncbi:hypothetical protein FIV42_13015 [Persicimonas caeni]|jgi:hypothetical protein|uniref:Uncharacterized protein n=1 Tax=Persicimonas caeni TaxID=2292766 RepID=A0A4Y6PV62_PERCE|nr:hypothetical protein [Persicimonas caeni]QDG51635.1 hypothetical protein FIV42_13015 [Persicimonas caeni]QED32856.1 hypothetical protein FRD00_13010 [Persicimonas caeni]